MVTNNIASDQQKNLLQKQLIENSDLRETPKDVEHNLDLDIKKLRRKLTDSALVERYSIVLEQMLYSIREGKKEMDVDVLVQCLAEIKTDIHYLKTKLLDPPVEAVDPQAKQNIELDKIINFNKPILIKSELNKRIVGSGWHYAEKCGRWSGPGKLSSVVLARPVTGEYKLEIIVGSEARPGLLNTLKVYINERPIDISISSVKNKFFPALITGTVVISEEDRESFLAVDLIVDETVTPSENDPRLIGILVHKICLIPCDTNIES